LSLLVRVPLQAMRDIVYPKRGRDFVDLANADDALRNAATTWVASDVAIYEGETRLADPQIVRIRASLAGDNAFQSYDAAVAHLSGPRLPDDTEFVWSQGLMDVLLEYPIESDRSPFSIETSWGRLGLRTVTALRFLPPGGAVRAFEFQGDAGLVRLDPRWHQAAARFVRLGFAHILAGTDHLLFLLCLVIPFRRLLPLVGVVTAFTVAHSITLILSAYDIAPGALWFPPLVETLIAASIVYMALENIVAVSVRRRWAIAFAFGLVHGFGFSFALRETLQFAGSHLLTSLLSFNVGVELGQLLVLALFIPGLTLLFRFVVAERMGTIILSALVAHTGWHWMTERAGRLSQYSLQWPAIDAAFLLTVVRALIVVLVLAGIAAGAWALVTTRRQPKETSSSL
jgi:HupE/UreJ protein